jgi:lipopolysaccharide/colanic/teichoic acid biosynthesis glycosyltransferase
MTAARPTATPCARLSGDLPGGLAVGRCDGPVVEPRNAPGYAAGDAPGRSLCDRPRDISVAKRGMDLCLLLPALALALLPGLMIALALLLLQGRPVFFISNRAGACGRPFRMIKFRSMALAGAATPGRAPEDAAAEGPAGGHLNARITPLGRGLRASRLDELPQLINILRGDMSFVGPRPPTLDCVRRFPEASRQLLQRRPGLSGLATLMLFGQEARLLQAAGSDAEAAGIYRRRCLPRKLALERIYHRRACLALDLWILAWTVLLLLSGGRRPLRLRRALRRLPVLRILAALRLWLRCWQGRRQRLEPRGVECRSEEGPGRTRL